MKTLPTTLGARLRAAPHRFDAAQALRLTELERPRLGTAAPPESEPTRLESVQGLAFAASPVAAIVEEEERVRVRVAFLGLTGPLGVLPQAYSELVHKADRLRNRAMSGFLDLFNHRLASLFVRAAEKYRLPLLVQRDAVREADSAVQSDACNPASMAMLALAGFGTPHLRGRLTVSDDLLLYYAGLFATRSRPAGALRSMLADYLGTPVRIEQFSGAWVAMRAEEQTRLDAPRSGGAFSRLGVDAVAGGRVWDAQGSFRIVVGPVDLAGMHALMPEGAKLRQLVDLVRAYVGIDLRFDVQVILRRDCVPDLQMHGKPVASSPRLGWNSWAKGLPALEDKHDIILDPDLVLRPKQTDPVRTPAIPAAGLGRTILEHV